MLPCPPWCGLATGHGFDEPLGDEQTRTHAHPVDRFSAANNDRPATVVVEQLEIVAVTEQGVEHLSYDVEVVVDVGVGDSRGFTPHEARRLAHDLLVAALIVEEASRS